MPNQPHDVAALDELTDMKEVEVEGEPVLLLRDGDDVRAVSATCPHAGAKLAEGVRRDERLVCPWHKATFCIRTGALLEPPAVDGLTRYDVTVADGRVLVARPEPPPPAPSALDPRCFVIIGAGAAGAVAAQSLREFGFAGRILMLDRENRVPHDRTLLSKYVLSGQQGGEKSPLQSQAYYRERRIERRTAEVVALDAAARRITCADGEMLSYDAALVATGATPRRPDVPGANPANVFLLRDRANADAILAQAERSERAVVLGASFIGMEVAASLRERGLDVIVVGQESSPFEKQLGTRVGGAFTSLHEKRGVQFRFGRKVAALEGERAVRRVRLDDDTVLDADLVVVGAGVTPAAKFVRGVTRREDGGIEVDARLRAADGLYAAGDIAAFPLYGDGAKVRVEHWRVAEQHGRAVARDMLGHETIFSAPPVFWTIQYLKRLDYIGHADAWDSVVVHGDLGAPAFLAYYVKDGRVTAAAGLDRDRDTAALVELFTLRHDWTPADLGASPAAVLAALSPPGNRATGAPA